MSKVRFIIGGQVADLTDGRTFPFKIDYQIEDILDFTKRKGGGSSRSFKLPGTQKNTNIFKNIAVARVDSDLVKLAQVASIEIDGIPVATGSVRMKQVTLQNNQWSREALEYDVLFLSDNSDWVSKMQGVKLADLDLDNHVYNLTNWSKQDETAATNDWVYTLIKWKNWINESSGYVTREEYTPALFLVNIIEKAFNFIGFIVNSAFFSTDFARRLIMPVPLKNYGSSYFEEFTNVIAERTITETFPGSTPTIRFDDDSTPPNTDPAGNYATGTGIYTAPHDGRFQFQCEFIIDNITAGAGSIGFLTAMLKNGSILVPAAPFSFNPVANGDILTIDIEVDLVSGDTMEFQVSPTPNVTSYDVKTGNMSVRGIRADWVLASGITVEWQYLVSDINLIELIRGFSELFNIYIHGDSAAQTVRIEPRNTFINSTKDMTLKVDGSKPGAKSFVDYSKYIQFKYKEDSNDNTVNFLDESERLPLYAGEYQLSDETATGEDEFVNSFFAPTLHIRDKTIAGFAGGDNAPQLPFLYPENYFEDKTKTETDYNFEPRILYHKGTVFVDLVGGAPALEGSISLLAASSGTRSAYPLSFMVNYYNDGSDPSLAFGEQTVLFGNTVQGLIRNYWLEHLATVNNGIQVEEWFRFTIIDLIQQDFRSRFSIRGDQYIVQKIEGFNPLIQDSTKVIMLEETCPEQSDIDRLTGSTKEGFINS